MIYSIICYTVPMNDAERELLHKYWLFKELDPTDFKYSVQQVHQSRVSGSRGLYTFIKEPSLVLDLPSFICSSCNAKIPVKNRTELHARLNDPNYGQCVKCKTKLKEKLEKRAIKTIRKFKDEAFPAVSYLEELSYEQSLSLLALISDTENLQIYLAYSPAEISITRSETIDQKILSSLKSLGALVYIKKLPAEVEQSYELIIGDFRRISYYRASSSRYAHDQYRNENLITEGVYINRPVIKDGVRATNLHNLLYAKILSASISPSDIHNIQRIIQGIQFAKLYQLIANVSREYQIDIADSNVLRALLDALAEKYAPDKLYFTFRVKARDVVVYMHQNDSNCHAERNYLAKFISNYIQFAESRGYGLDRSWSIPTDIEISPFEAIFSQLYLDGEFNFNRLSSKAIVAKWLEKVELLPGQSPPSLST